VGAGDGDRILGYQLFQLSKQLTAGELLVLRAAHTLTAQSYQESNEWCRALAAAVGHNLQSLTTLQAKRLEQLNLVSCSVSNMYPQNRVTDLGLRFCENLKEYQTVSKDAHNRKS
jgi:hypothetical protein